MGARGAIKLLSADLFTIDQWIRPKGYSYPIKLRGKTTDAKVFYKTFHFKEYPFIRDDGICFIVDGGAYAGYTAIYFNKLYPNAKIVALEPALENFNLLADNTEKIDQIEPQQLALWDECHSVKAVFDVI